MGCDYDMGRVMSTTEVRLAAHCDCKDVMFETNNRAYHLVERMSRLRAETCIADLFPGSRVSITTQENTRTSGHD